MANEPEVDRPEFEDEGGPVKSFLEHLEDLRWILIKCAVATAVAMLLCLIAGDKVVGLLKRPLDKAKIKYPGSNQVITVMFATNRLGTFQLEASQRTNFPFSTNRFIQSGTFASRTSRPRSPVSCSSRSRSLNAYSQSFSESLNDRR